MFRYLLIMLLCYQYYSVHISKNDNVLIIPKNDTDIYPKNDTDIHPTYVLYTLHRKLI